MSGWEDTSTSTVERRTKTSNQTLGVEDISREIQSFGKLVYDLEVLQKNLGTSRDSDNLRRKIKNKKKECQSSMKQIEGIFATPSIRRVIMGHVMSQVEMKREHLRKLENQFKSIQNHYQQLCKNIQVKEKMEGFNRDIDKLFEKENDESSDEEEYQIQKQKRKEVDFSLSMTDASTLDVEKIIAKETQNELLDLEADFRELSQAVLDVKQLVEEQQKHLDIIETNVEDATAQVEVGVENIKISRDRTIVNGTLKQLGKVLNIPKLFGL